jgi:excisionase family DNA binding protein
MKMNVNDLMTIREVAEYHGKSRNAIYIAIHRGKLKPVFQKGWSPLFSRQDVEAMVWARGKGARSKGAAKS